jgi:hypothetical protein
MMNKLVGAANDHTAPLTQVPKDLSLLECMSLLLALSVSAPFCLLHVGNRGSC